MERKKIRALVGAGTVSAAIATAIALAPASLGRAPSSAPPTGTCTELAASVDPQDVPIDTGYDPERGLVFAHSGGRTFVMRPDDPVCRAITSVRALLDDTMQVHRQNSIEACRAMSEVLRRGDSEVRGRRVDRAAAQRFIDTSCTP